jgi:histidinol-phosphate aminotransferase
MKIKKHLLDLKSESYEKDVFAEGMFTDCALGRNNFGVSDRLQEILKNYDDSRFWDTPDISYSDLKRELCSFWINQAELKAENIKVENGSRFVQERFNKIFISEGVKVLGYAPQYTGYVMVVLVMGGHFTNIKLNLEEGYKFNIDHFLPEINSDFTIVFIDNPNNPTGQIIDLRDIEEIVKQADRKDCVVMVDEAYGDFLNKEDSAIGLINKYNNLIVTRTFSKGYGMGKTKVGYGVMSSKLGEYYDKVSLGVPGSVSDLGAKLSRESLKDQDFIKKYRDWVKKNKSKCLQGLNEMGYLIAETYEYCPIFVMGHKDPEVDLRRELIAKNILSVSGSHFRNLGKNYVRINLPENPIEILDKLAVLK